MNRLKGIVAVSLFLLLASNTVIAQNLIGKIDLRRVMLLHPTMIQYNPTMQAFKVARSDNEKKQVVNEAKSVEAEVEKLNAELKDLKTLIKEEDKKFDKTIEGLSKKYLTKLSTDDEGATGMKKMTYSMEASSAEVEHNARLTAYYAKYSEAEDRIMKLTEFGYHDEFTTPAETEKRFNSILSEVKATIKKIADQKGISVVLNTGYKRAIKDNKTSSSVSISDENSLGAIFDNPIPHELVSDEAAVSGYYQNLNSAVKNWLRDADPVLNRINDNLLDTDIILGGVDLTQEVLKNLYDTYKLDPSVANAVIQSALTY